MALTISDLRRQKLDEIQFPGYKLKQLKEAKANDGLPSGKDEYFVRAKILNGKKWGEWIELNSWTSESACNALIKQRFNTTNVGGEITYVATKGPTWGGNGAGYKAKYQIVCRVTRYEVDEFPEKPLKGGWDNYREPGRDQGFSKGPGYYPGE